MENNILLDQKPSRMLLSTSLGSKLSSNKRNRQNRNYMKPNGKRSKPRGSSRTLTQILRIPLHQHNRTPNTKINTNAKNKTTQNQKTRVTTTTQKHRVAKDLQPPTTEAKTNHFHRNNNNSHNSNNTNKKHGANVDNVATKHPPKTNTAKVTKTKLETPPTFLST